MNTLEAQVSCTLIRILSFLLSLNIDTNTRVRDTISSHDKKRHFESTHLQQSHTCRFCNKTFSRNDSLKRHQDNGCDKDPEFNP